MRGELTMTTSIKPPLQSGAASSTPALPVRPAQIAPSSSQIPEPTPVSITAGKVETAESAAQLPQPHAVNAAPAIPP